MPPRLIELTPDARAQHFSMPTAEELRQILANVPPVDFSRDVDWEAIRERWIELRASAISERWDRMVRQYRSPDGDAAPVANTLENAVTPDQIDTLLDLARADDRTAFQELASCLGVEKGKLDELWTGTRARLKPR